MKTLEELLIDLDKCNKRLDRIRNDPDYIADKVAEIWKDKPKRNYRQDIATLLDTF